MRRWWSDFPSSEALAAAEAALAEAAAKAAAEAAAAEAAAKAAFIDSLPLSYIRGDPGSMPVDIPDLPTRIIDRSKNWGGYGEVMKLMGAEDTKRITLNVVRDTFEIHFENASEIAVFEQTEWEKASWVTSELPSRGDWVLRNDAFVAAGGAATAAAPPTAAEAEAEAAAAAMAARAMGAI